MTVGKKVGCGPSDISIGSVFIREDAPLPDWLGFNYQECGVWKQLVDADGLALERSAVETGWHFSYLASAVVSKRWGGTPQSALRRALKNVMEVMGRTGFNSFEISGMTARKLLFWYSARLTASPRHLSPSPFLKSFNPHFFQHVTTEQASIFWHAADAEPQVKGL